MDLSEFKDLPGNSRVWIHGFERKLNKTEQKTIRREFGRFLPQWVSHGAPVKAAFTILFDQFVVTAAHCQGGISGCSVDSFVRNLKMLKTLYGLDALIGGSCLLPRQGRGNSGSGSTKVSRCGGLRSDFR